MSTTAGQLWEYEFSTGTLLTGGAGEVELYVREPPSAAAKQGAAQHAPSEVLRVTLVAGAPHHFELLETEFIKHTAMQEAAGAAAAPRAATRGAAMRYTASVPAEWEVRPDVDLCVTLCDASGNACNSEEDMVLVADVPSAQVRHDAHWSTHGPLGAQRDSGQPPVGARCSARRETFSTHIPGRQGRGQRAACRLPLTADLPRGASPCRALPCLRSLCVAGHALWRALQEPKGVERDAHPRPQRRHLPQAGAHLRARARQLVRRSPPQPPS